MRLPKAILKSLSPNPQLDLVTQLLLEIYRGTAYWPKGESARVCQTCGMELAEGSHRADSVRISREVPNAGVSHNTLLLHPLYFGSQILKNLIMTSLIGTKFLGANVPHPSLMTGRSPFWGLSGPS